MNFETKIYSVNDFDFYELWARKRKLPLVDKKMLPSNGLVILESGTPIAIGFLYITDSHMASIGNIMSDPDSIKKTRAEAIEWLVDILCMRAQELGYTQVNCATNIPSLMKKFEDLGFEKCEENVSHFRRGIECQSQD